MATRSIPERHLEAWGSLLAAQATLVGAVEEALASAGLPPIAWYDVLWPLRRAGRPLRMGELSAEVFTVGRTGLTRLVDRLEAAGALTRAPAAGDRRGVEVAITPEGAKLLRAMWPVYAGVLRARFVDVFDEREAEALADLMGRLRPAPPG
jgi:DNA-binding MarR family transcriptional regulator